MNDTLRKIEQLEPFVDVYEDRVVLNLPNIDGPVVLKDQDLDYCFAYPEYVRQIVESTDCWEDWNETIPTIIQIRERKRNCYYELGFRL